MFPSWPYEFHMFTILAIDHLVLRISDLERMLGFYCDVLGCTVERRQDHIGLVQLRAGRSLIDLVTVEGALGKAGGAAPGTEGRNLQHFCLRIEPFDEAAIRNRLAAHGIEVSEAETRYGAEGYEPSIYLVDPEGNEVELKGPPSAPTQEAYEQVLKFWFEEIEPAQWWKKDEAFDRMIVERFAQLHRSAAAGELFEWRNTARGRLAEIIVLDQFSRNMFRDSPLMFACDPMALVLAQEAIAVGADKTLNQAERSFLYMPFMHSESLGIHEVAVELFRQNGNPHNLDFELRHKAIIERFGRYPHRNTILGRQSTDEELEFLRQPGSSF